MTTIETLYDADGKRRLRIIALANGAFTFEEEHFSDERREQCWIASVRRHSVCESAEIARREARRRVKWLAAQQRSTHD